MHPALLSTAVDAAREDLIALLQQMVQSPSLPDHEAKVQELIARKLESLGLEVEWFEGQFESGQTPLDHPFLRQLRLAHEQVTGSAPAMRGVTYGSDMRLFTNHARIPATHYGPGDVAQAHAANEFVPLAEVLTATKVVAKMITLWCGGEQS